MKAVFDGRFLEVGPIPIMNLPVNATGVFETVLWRDGHPMFWIEHWARFEAGLRWFQLDIPVNEAEVRRLSAQLVNENGLDVGVVRYSAYRQANGTPHWQIEASPPRPHMARAAFNVTRGPELPPVDAGRGLKHLDRRLWFDALNEARARGFDEVLLSDSQGRVVEGGVSNIFLVHTDALITPPLSAGPLPGVMRHAVLSVARAIGCAVREQDVPMSDLGTADEVWLTNSLIGVRPVRAFNTHSYPAAHPTLDRLRAAFKAAHGWDPAEPLQG